MKLKIKLHLHKILSASEKNQKAKRAESIVIEFLLIAQVKKATKASIETLSHTIINLKFYFECEIQSSLLILYKKNSLSRGVI